MKVVTGDGTFDLGVTETTPTIGITDYSRRETDEFGVTTVVERGFARRMSVRMAVPFDQVDGLQRRLAALRATAATWVADDQIGWLTVEGLYKEFDIDLAVPPVSYCTLTVEGLADTATTPDPGGDPAPDGQASTLQLLSPLEVTGPALVLSNVPEDDAPAWAGGATYAAGARVIRAHRVFESLTGANSGNDPADSIGSWLDLGPTNRWAMFDEALGTATARNGSITVTLQSGPVDAVALLDVMGTNARVQAGAFDQTQAVVGGAVVFTGLPLDAAQVTVTITGAATSIGTLLIGRMRALGVTEASPTAGITDFSRKEVDDFGEVTVVERAWAKRMATRALIRSDAVDLVANRIAAVRARPSLWIGETGMDSLTVYGFFRDFAIEVAENVSTLSLAIEGLSKAAKAQPIPVSVDWPDIGDPDGTKPDPGADVTGENTSKDTDAVGGRPASEILGDLIDLESGISDQAERLDGRIDATDASLNVVAGELNAESARLDGRIDGADTAVETVADELETERARLDSRIDGADAALTTARARLATEAERLRAMAGLTRVGVLAEVRQRITAVSAEVVRVNGIIAQLGDPATGLPVAHALIATLETVTVDLANPSSLASKLSVLEAAIGDADATLSARIGTLEETVVDLEANKAEATRVETVEADLVDLEADIEARATITYVDSAITTEQGVRAFAIGQLSAAFDDLDNEVSSKATITQLNEAIADVTSASAEAIDELAADIGGLTATVGNQGEAIVDLEASKAEASALSSLGTTVTGLSGTVGGINTRLITAESAITSQGSAISGLDTELSEVSGSLSLIAGNLSTLTGRVTGAETAATSLAGTVSSINVRVGETEDAVDAAAASITAIEQAGVTARAAAIYRSERTSAQVGLTRVTALAERNITATAFGAAYTRLDAVDLSIAAPVGGITARIGSLESAVVDLNANKASVSQFNTLSGTVSGLVTTVGGLGPRLTTAEGTISDQATLIAGLDLDLGQLDGALGLVAADLATLDDRIGDVEGLTATLVSTSSSLVARAGALEDRADDADDALDALGGRMTGAEGSITDVQSAGATTRAAVAYRAERMSAQSGLGRVTALAERRVAADDKTLTYQAINAVDLKLTTPTTGALARIATAESAIINLNTGKVSVSVFNTLTARVGDVEGSFTTLAQVVNDGLDAAVSYEIVAAGSGGKPAKARFLSGPGGSSLDLVAESFTVANGETLVPVIVVENNQAKINQALIRGLMVAPRADSTIFLPPMLRPIIRLASDGAAVTYETGGTFGANPERIVPDLNGLPTPAPGESYDIRPTQVTPTGFVARCKKLVASTPVTQMSAVGQNVGGTPQWRTDKPTAANAYNQYYEFRIFVSAPLVQSERNDTVSGNGQFGYDNTYRAHVAFYALEGSTWRQIALENIQFTTTTLGPPIETNLSGERTLTLQTDINIAQGANRFGVHAVQGSVGAFYHVRYDTQATTTETPVSGLIPFTIYPPLPA